MYHNGYANQNARIALSNDPVFNNDKYDILSESQYGFREHCSTQHALNDILTKNNIYAEYL